MKITYREWSDGTHQKVTETAEGVVIDPIAQDEVSLHFRFHGPGEYVVSPLPPVGTDIAVEWNGTPVFAGRVIDDFGGPRLVDMAQTARVANVEAH